jgi:hypothetical protein
MQSCPDSYRDREKKIKEYEADYAFKRVPHALLFQYGTG